MGINVINIYIYIYQHHMNTYQIVHQPLKPIQLPFPKWYDKDAKHVWVMGHSIDDC
jgi:hypothetical protein